MGIRAEEEEGAWHWSVTIATRVRVNAPIPIRWPRWTGPTRSTATRPPRPPPSAAPPSRRRLFPLFRRLFLPRSSSLLPHVPLKMTKPTRYSSNYLLFIRIIISMIYYLSICNFNYYWLVSYWMIYLFIYYFNYLLFIDWFIIQIIYYVLVLLFLLFTIDWLIDYYFNYWLNLFISIIISIIFTIYLFIYLLLLI